MKIRIRTAAVLGALSLTSAASAAAVVSNAAPRSVYSETAVEETLAHDGYTVKAVNGNIGVYYMSELIFETDISVATLRESDRESLVNGVDTDNYEEVLRLLEDFSS